MSVWDDMGLDQVEKQRVKRTTDKTQTWIKKFTDYLTEQKSLLKTVEKKPDQAKKTKGKRSRTHVFWFEEKEVFVFGPRYGSRTVYLQPGKSQITAPSIEKMQERIDKLIQITKDGHLNAVLEEVAKRPTKNVAASQEGGTTASEKKAKA